MVRLGELKKMDRETGSDTLEIHFSIDVSLTSLDPSRDVRDEVHLDGCSSGTSNPMRQGVTGSNVVFMWDHPQPFINSVDDGI